MYVCMYVCSRETALTPSTEKQNPFVLTYYQLTVVAEILSTLRSP